MRICKTVVTICAISAFLSACGRANRQAEWRIPSTESFIIHSSIAQRDFEIMVALPRGYSESHAKYPVLYVLDANGAFPIAVQTARFLTFDPELKEEPVIVGVGYPLGLYRNTLAARTKDFTPTSDPEWVRQLSSQYHFSPEGSGGAAAFLQFLAKEMMPVVETRYRLDERRRALHGYSLGGLFAVYVLFHEPELFENYLIGAPALWWDHEVAWKFEQEFAQAHKDLQARVFLTVGLLDERVVPIVQKLDELFRSRKYGSLVWHTQFFPEETHDSAIALSLTRGMRYLYGDMAQ